MSFESLGLRAELLRAVADQGYTEPTVIQQKAIPAVLEGRDIMAAAQTGTGKTAGFTLPLLQRLSNAAAPQTGKKRPIRALILTPTRELAAQVGESVATYGQHLHLSSAVIFGGVNINPQIDLLRRGIDILVATPGRLLDHAGQKTLDLSSVEILVLDEADRMLDMGFIRDIRKVLALLPAKRQNLLFSATFSDEIKQLADGLLNSPQLIEAARRNTPAETVEQLIHPVDRERKRELLSFMVGSRNWRQVLVFTRTKHGANRLAEQLERDGIRAAAIHGNKSQGARTRALADFKSGAVRVLVATDIAARGLDIDQLPHVVNYELPNVPEDYVHRIGRTGRAGNEGQAISLVCVDEHKLLRDIERLLKRDLPKEVVDGFTPDPSIKPEPILQRSRGGRNIDMPRRDRSPEGNRPAARQDERNRKGSGADHRSGHNSQGGRNVEAAPGHRNDGRPANGAPNHARREQTRSHSDQGRRQGEQTQRNSRSSTGRERPALLGGNRFND